VGVSIISLSSVSNNSFSLWFLNGCIVILSSLYLLGLIAVQVWFLKTLRSHSFILVSAYNFSADQTAT
jgi:hypothetical protein